MTFIDRKTASLFTLFLTIFLLLVIINWVGFTASDDAVYVKGAYGLLNEFPFLGEHGTFRFIITAPIALMMWVFGENEVSIALPTLFYAVAFIIVLISFFRRRAGDKASIFVGLMMVTSPLLVTQSSIASIDIIEAFYVFASLLFFIKASETTQNTVRWLILSGMMAGLAFLTRETTVFLLVYYGILFAMGVGIKRLQYFVMAFGFFTIWGLETLYFWVFSGDPLYRFSRSFGHDSTIDRSIDLAGNLIIHPIIDPLLVLLFNQEFGVLFWVLGGIVVWWFVLGKRKQNMPDQNTVSRDIADDTGQHAKACKLIAGLGTVWFLCAGGVGNLLPLNPRYFLVTNIAAILVTALFLSDILQQGRKEKRAAYLCLTAIMAVNLLGLWAENKNFLFAEKQLARVAANQDATIYTDPETLHRATYLLKWEGASEQVQAIGYPPVCSLYFQNKKYMPAQLIGWDKVEIIEPPNSFLKKPAEFIGLYDLLPNALRFRLNGGHKGAAIFIYDPEGRC
ncbi:glycosyltransferase family 39 protein [Kordiimonas sp. SCSIO 12610]|uniref:ArnT family glycosyltransferase n=1 Tax=Kordiimonas sp. SCSIO 12610 TaxID=2829597 RepID=UPI00210E53CC|nr:glycosyltransferase family 39 protein [Kordiimonas sp. SCSIO 12610]UTW56341.1 glycosyltransferase family 39 protein [Kordiimonas sp. SCSIO 12610]